MPLPLLLAFTPVCLPSPLCLFHVKILDLPLSCEMCKEEKPFPSFHHGLFLLLRDSLLCLGYVFLNSFCNVCKINILLLHSKVMLDLDGIWVTECMGGWTSRGR